MISVCIPVFNTERWLWQCLESVAAQDFSDIEIIVLSDASRGKDDAGHSAKKIVHKFQKKLKQEKDTSIEIRFFENGENRAPVEVRRSMVGEARGEYIFMLDSDDFLPPDALSTLYNAAVQNDADIVQGDIVALDSEGKNHVTSDNEIHPFPGILEGHEVYTACFRDYKYRPLIAARLIRRSIYVKAFEQIPYICAHMAEEVIQYFFIALYSQKYVGISMPVYFYRQGTGVTTRKVSTLNDWKRICSAASIITAIYSWIQEESEKNGKPPFTPDEMEGIQKLAKAYCVNNVKHLRNLVDKDFYDEARETLCYYWGEESVQNTERFLNG